MKFQHSLFKYYSYGPWHEAPGGLVRPGVYVFERAKYVKPNAKQVAEYRRSKKIVEGLGGRMLKEEYEIAGKAEPLSKRDVQDILECIRKSNQKIRIVSHWNGRGCYTMSVGVAYLPPKKGKK